jgi:uncharacterized protein YkwD
MLRSLLSKYALHGNWIDLIFAILVIYFILINEGFISSFLDLLGFFFSFIFSFKTYGFFAELYINNFSLSKGFADAFGFATAWLLAEVIFFLVSKFILKKISPKFFKSKINIFLCFIPAICQAILLYTFILTLIVSLPVQGNLKADILNSKTGPFLITFSQKFEEKLKPVFHEAIIETLNFLTIKPGSEETVDLNFKLNKNDLKTDPSSETAMFNLINEERQSRGIKPLTFNKLLTKAAEEYAEEMFLNGFFSHYSKIDNSSPAERLERKNVDYFITGENLAFAPDVQIAHSGLMNSEGHRENILSPEFSEVGIGIIDGGMFGKIFVQEFTN